MSRHTQILKKGDKRYEDDDEYIPFKAYMNKVFGGNRVDLTGGEQILSGIEGFDDLFILKNYCKYIQTHIENVLVKYTDLMEERRLLLNKINDLKSSSKELALQYDKVDEELKTSKSRGTSKINEHKLNTQVCSLKFVQRTYVVLKDHVRKMEISDIEDMQTYIGIKSNIRELWERGNYIFVNITLVTNVIDKDIIKNITILCDFDHTIEQIQRKACHFYNLPYNKYILSDERGATIPKKDEIVKIFLSQ